MSVSTPDLRSLGRSATSALIPPPRVRWGTRVALPLLILLIAAGLLAYAARSVLVPATGVWVVPVVPIADRAGRDPASASLSTKSSVIVQAPGWIEPNPYAVTVQALADGVIKEVLVLEGERVNADQVIARMIDNESRLTVRLTEAEFDAQRAAFDRAQAELKGAEARSAVIRDELDRKKPLGAAGGVSEGQLARLQLQLTAADRDVDAAKAAIAEAEARVKSHRVICEEARLRFNRMEIRSPSAGVVMQRLVEPGTRISMNAPSSDAAPMGVVRLYDPARLQARVDVPLADAGKIAVGTAAEIVSEASPDLIFEGEVIRIVPEANIQRNTVQFKVGIKNRDQDSGVLKPEMLTRVRFLGYGPAQSAGSAREGLVDSHVGIPADLVREAKNGIGRVLVADFSHGTTGPHAELREVMLGQTQADGLIEVLAGLNPGDRLIADAPPTLKEGDRVRVLGEKKSGREAMP